MTHPVEKSSSSPAAYPAPAVSVEEISAIATLIQNRSYQAASDAIQRVIPRLPISTYTLPVSTQFCGLAQKLKQEMLDSIETEDFVHAACLGKIIARMCVADETFNSSHGGRMFVYERDIRDPLIEALIDDPGLERRFRFWLEGQSPDEHPFFTSFENPPVRVPPPRPAPLPVAPPVAPSHARSAPLAAPPPAYLFEEGFAEPMPLAPEARPEDAYDDEVEPPAGFGSRAAQPPLPPRCPAPLSPAPVPAPRVSAAAPLSDLERLRALDELNRRGEYRDLPMRLAFNLGTRTGMTEQSAETFKAVMLSAVLELVQAQSRGDPGESLLSLIHSMTTYLSQVKWLLPRDKQAAFDQAMSLDIVLSNEPAEPLLPPPIRRADDSKQNPRPEVLDLIDQGYEHLALRNIQLAKVVLQRLNQMDHRGYEAQIRALSAAIPPDREHYN